MRWRALQEGKVYIKQILNDKQYTVEEVRNMVEMIVIWWIESYDLVKHCVEPDNFGLEEDLSLLT